MKTGGLFSWRCDGIKSVKTMAECIWSRTFETHWNVQLVCCLITPGSITPKSKHTRTLPSARKCTWNPENADTVVIIVTLKKAGFGVSVWDTSCCLFVFGGLFIQPQQQLTELRAWTRLRRWGEEETKHRNKSKTYIRAVRKPGRQLKSQDRW